MVSQEENALIRGILLDPEQDLPRLVYADWLSDQGRYEREQQIRDEVADCTLGKVQGLQFCVMSNRPLTLADPQPLDYGNRNPDFEWREFTTITWRGFISSVILETNLMTNKGFLRDMFSSCPIVSVSLRDNRPYWDGSVWAVYDQSRDAKHPDVPVEAELPTALFRELSANEEWSERNSRFFGERSEERLRIRLERALANYGRRVAGLPSLS